MVTEHVLHQEEEANPSNEMCLRDTELALK